VGQLTPALDDLAFYQFAPPMQVTHTAKSLRFFEGDPGRQEKPLPPDPTSSCLLWPVLTRSGTS
jgi:hypothetical protein